MHIVTVTPKHLFEDKSKETKTRKTFIYFDYNYKFQANVCRKEVLKSSIHDSFGSKYFRSASCQPCGSLLNVHSVQLHPILTMIYPGNKVTG